MLSMLERYNAWLQKMMDQGVIMTEYPCVECNQPLLAKVPPEGETYDSAACYPMCRVSYFRVVNSDGTVDVYQ